MTRLPFHQVDAFATQAFEGNPAAVMPLDAWLPDDVLQKIAAENNLSETAFTIPSNSPDADFELRWFTPTVEVGMCGHATFASGHVLIAGDEIRFATRKAGILTVRRKDRLLWLDLPAWHSQPHSDQAVLDALGVAGEVRRAQAAEDVLIVTLADEAAVRAVAPDFRKLKAIDALVIVTAPGDMTDIASRVFAANVGIDEDPVTGAAHAALVPYWAEVLGKPRFTAIQASQRGGLLDCELSGDRVILGGQCVTVITGEFHL